VLTRKPVTAEAFVTAVTVDEGLDAALVPPLVVFAVIEKV
jgi:hypothetical protein